MSREIARRHLEKYGFGDKILELEVSSATVALAALALGCEEARIAKTLSFADGEGAILVVAAGDAKIDNRRFKDCFGKKAKMLPAEDVERLIGHAVGGVCPFGVRAGVPVYLDESLKRFETVFPAAGASNNAVEMTIAELERTSEYTDWVFVTQIPEQ
ncbi:MAG: YbaK/EbsC family protein [Clostridia bacterium]|nr:YbaK/EbsC family protein [Clostridia bacterium]MBR3680565.1 YbaK/EbsC family protein [Clostridia bacterium]